MSADGESGGFPLKCGACAWRYGAEKGPADFQVVDTPEGAEVWTRVRSGRRGRWLRLDFSPRFDFVDVSDLPQRGAAFCDHGHAFNHPLRVYVDAALDAMRAGSSRGLVKPSPERLMSLDASGRLRSRATGRRATNGAASAHLAELARVLDVLHSRTTAEK
jgi:hypothetical protein